VTYSSWVLLQKRRSVDRDFDEVLDLSRALDGDGRRQRRLYVLPGRLCKLHAKAAEGDACTAVILGVASIVEWDL
jgi:hypothetical protein